MGSCINKKYIYIKMVKSYLLIILIIFTTVLTNRLLIVYEIGISASRSRGGGSVDFFRSYSYEVLALYMLSISNPDLTDKIYRCLFYDPLNFIWAHIHVLFMAMKTCFHDPLS